MAQYYQSPEERFWTRVIPRSDGCWRWDGSLACQGYDPEHLEPVTCKVNILRGVSPSAHHALQTHCVNGHEFTPENTRISVGKRRRRVCRACTRDQERKRRAMGDVEVSKGIVVNPHRCGGKATVKGTRITAEMLAHLMEGEKPVPPDTIIENYSVLTFNDIANVRGWARREAHASS